MSRAKPQEFVEMDVEQEEAILRRAEQAGVPEEDLFKIRAVFESYAYISGLIDRKTMSVDRLRKLLFGSRTEKTADVVGRGQEAPQGDEAATDSAPKASAEASEKTNNGSPTRKPGHGRNGADKY